MNTGRLELAEAYLSLFSRLQRTITPTACSPPGRSVCATQRAAVSLATRSPALSGTTISRRRLSGTSADLKSSERSVASDVGTLRYACNPRTLLPLADARRRSGARSVSEQKL